MVFGFHEGKRFKYVCNDPKWRCWWSFFLGIVRVWGLAIKIQGFPCNFCLKSALYWFETLLLCFIFYWKWIWKCRGVFVISFDIVTEGFTFKSDILLLVVLKFVVGDCFREFWESQCKCDPFHFMWLLFLLEWVINIVLYVSLTLHV